MRMRRTSGLLTAILVGLSVAGATPAAAQSQFVQVDYMKVAPGQADAYLQVEQKMWKPIHEARVKAGNAVAWYLYRVVSPSGSQVDHNYATVAVYSSFEALENPYPNELLAKIVPAQSMPEFTRKTLAARELVRSETWGAMDRTPETPLAKPAPFLSVEYMKVPSGGDANYVETEKLWKKLHDVRIKEGTLLNWGAYGRVLPGGSDYPYNYATVSGYGHFKDSHGARLRRRRPESGGRHERQRAGRPDREGERPRARRGVGARRLRTGAAEVGETHITAPTDGAAPVPEPTTLVLLGSGLIGAGVRRYRQRRSA